MGGGAFNPLEDPELIWHPDSKKSTEVTENCTRQTDHGANEGMTVPKAVSALQMKHFAAELRNQQTQFPCSSATCDGEANLQNLSLGSSSKDQAAITPSVEDKGRYQALISTEGLDVRRLKLDPPTMSHPALKGPAIRGVNLGGWLLAEKWIKTSLWRGMPNDDLTDGATVQFMCSLTGTYVGAEGGGGGQVNASIHIPKKSETFRLWRLSDSTFNFKVQNEQFITADNGGGGTVKAVAMAAGDWETFQIIRKEDDPNLVQLRSFDGHWLLAKDGKLTAECETDPGWGVGPAVFVMEANPIMQGTFQLCNGWGQEKAKQILEEHMSTFIVEDDFKFLAERNVNAVRIPIGWWLCKEEPSPPWPYVAGAAYYLDKAFEWAAKYGLAVVVDLHAAPGSQNGWDHGGSRDGSHEWGQPGSNCVQESLEIVEWLAQKYCHHPSLLAIQVLNEPRNFLDIDLLKQYYILSYNIIRKYSPITYVLVSTQIDGDPVQWAGFMGDTNVYKNVIIDVAHWYAAWLPANNDAAYYVAYMYTSFLPQLLKLVRLNPTVPVVIGEWSMNMRSNPPPNNIDFLSFSYAQIQCWAQATGGWFFFTLQVENNDTWSFRKMVEAQFLDNKMFTLNPAKWDAFPQF